METEKARGNWIDPRHAAIPPDEIENWLNDEIEAGIAPSSLHRHYRTLRRVLQVAVDKQRVVSNPCDRVEPPRVPRREMVFLDWKQAVDLAEAHTDRYQALVYLAVDSGMRWSELIGLLRSKLDIRARKVRVTEQLIHLETGEWLRKETKTPASVRSITISSVTAEIMAHHLGRYAAPGPDGLVFPNRSGNPIAAASFSLCLVRLSSWSKTLTVLSREFRAFAALKTTKRHSTPASSTSWCIGCRKSFGG